MGTTIKKTVGERIVDLFVAEGISHIFSIPDPGYLSIQHHALKKGIKVIAPRHEAAGAMMADGVSRMSGHMSVVMAAEGPGVANMLPAAVLASKENIPTLFIAAQRDRVYDSAVRRSKFQYTPQPRFFEAAMKYQGVLQFPELVDEVFREAFRQAQTGKPGPVYIEIPENTEFTELEFDPIIPPECYRLVKQQANPSAINDAVKLLQDAKMPVIIAGTAIHTSRAHEAFVRMAETLKCPVIPTWGGRGTLPETHSQVLVYSAPQANAAIAEADVVLAIGTSIGETAHYGKAVHFAKGNIERKWIYIERDPSAIGVNRKIDVPLVGDLRDVMPQLCDALEAIGSFTSPSQLADWRKEFVDTRQQAIDAAPDTMPIHPGRLMVEARNVIPDDAVIVRDGGCTTLWEIAYHEQRSHDYLWTSKFGHLGAGLPYVIGAQLVVGSERRVALITGDSALMFHMMELETAARHNLPIVVIINYDAAWGMEQFCYVDTFGEDGKIEVEYSKDLRFDLVAQGLGCHGEYVDKTDDIGPAIQRAFDSGKTALVQVATDAEINWREAPNWDEFITWYGVDGAYKEMGKGYQQN